MHQHPSAIHADRTAGQRVADGVAATMGSWRFITIQSGVLAVWLALNILAVAKHWDPYPFILLNLMLSFQAAYSAPIIMMSQNRASAIDRAHAESAYEHIDALIGNQDRQHDLLLNVTAVLLVQHKQQSERSERIEAALKTR